MLEIIYVIIAMKNVLVVAWVQVQITAHSVNMLEMDRTVLKIVRFLNLITKANANLVMKTALVVAPVLKTNWDKMAATLARKL